MPRKTKNKSKESSALASAAQEKKVSDSIKQELLGKKYNPSDKSIFTTAVEEMGPLVNIPPHHVKDKRGFQKLLKLHKNIQIFQETIAHIEIKDESILTKKGITARIIALTKIIDEWNAKNPSLEAMEHIGGLIKKAAVNLVAYLHEAYSFNLLNQAKILAENYMTPEKKSLFYANMLLANNPKNREDLEFLDKVQTEFPDHQIIQETAAHLYTIFFMEVNGAQPDDYLFCLKKISANPYSLGEGLYAQTFELVMTRIFLLSKECDFNEDFLKAFPQISHAFKVDEREAYVFQKLIEYKLGFVARGEVISFLREGKFYEDLKGCEFQAFENFHFMLAALMVSIYDPSFALQFKDLTKSEFAKDYSYIVKDVAWSSFIDGDYVLARDVLVKNMGELLDCDDSYLVYSLYRMFSFFGFNKEGRLLIDKFPPTKEEETKAEPIAAAKEVKPVEVEAAEEYIAPLPLPKHKFTAIDAARIASADPSEVAPEELHKYFEYIKKIGTTSRAGPSEAESIISWNLGGKGQYVASKETGVFACGANCYAVIDKDILQGCNAILARKFTVALESGFATRQKGSKGIKKCGSIYELKVLGDDHRLVANSAYEDLEGNILLVFDQLCSHQDVARLASKQPECRYLLVDSCLEDFSVPSQPEYKEDVALSAENGPLDETE